MVDVPKLVTLILLYVAILVIGLLASWWFRRKHPNEDEREMSLVAGRKLGGLVGILTMTATTVGGGFINGIAESISTQGLLWTLAPFGIFIGLNIGGLLYAKRMRDECYLTMLDPFQARYHGFVIGLLYIAAIVGDIFWTASILAALGTSVSVIIELDVTLAIIISAGVSLLYTFFGQMISVAFTDVVQLLLITVGLVLSVPFVLTNPNVADIGSTSHKWVGEVSSGSASPWVDLLITMTLGTIPWQTYFQRVLSMQTSTQARALSMFAAFGAFLLAIPPAIIGVASVGANWTATDLGASPQSLNQSSLVLPYTLKYFTPSAVSLIGLCTVAAAVMSSMDSAILSSASMFSHNLYGNLIAKKAPDSRLYWVQRVALVVVTLLATLTAIFVKSIYGIFIMAADLVFVIMFPQLTAILFVPISNSYGAILGYLTGAFLRLAGGEPNLSLPPLIKYPFYSEEFGQVFPFRTFAMLSSLFVIVMVSLLTRALFLKKCLPPKLDFLGCFYPEMLLDDRDHVTQHGGKKDGSNEWTASSQTTSTIL